MKNIYDIFESRQEDLLDAEFEKIQEGYEELLILEKEAVVTLENLVYNNPEKKKLSVLMEEAEVNETMKNNNIINKMREQMKKVLAWIMNIFKFQQKMIDEGVKLVKSVDLNQCMVKIKRKGNAPTIKYHPRKAPFDKIRTDCVKRMDKAISKIKHHSSNRAFLAVEDNAMSDIDDEDRLENNLKSYRLTKEDLEEVRLDTLNTIAIENTLLALPAANKHFQTVKSKVQDAYNKAINSIRNDHSDDTKNRHVKKGSRELNKVNMWFKAANERIRAYSKLLSIIFNEEYGAARKIVAVAKGESINNSEEENK